jgi:hypothetical protein
MVAGAICFTRSGKVSRAHRAINVFLHSHTPRHVAFLAGVVLLGKFQFAGELTGGELVEMARLVTFGESHSLRGMVFVGDIRPPRRLTQACRVLPRATASRFHVRLRSGSRSGWAMLGGHGSPTRRSGRMTRRTERRLTWRLYAGLAIFNCPPQTFQRVVVHRRRLRQRVTRGGRFPLIGPRLIGPRLIGPRHGRPLHA